MNVFKKITVFLILILVLFCRKPTVNSSLPDSGNSPYVLNSRWKDQNGKEMKLGELTGHYVFMSMFYSSCSSLCPRIVTDIKRLEAKLPGKILKKSKFVLVSLDEEKDSPAKMKAYAAKMQLNESRWILLSGSNDSIRELSAVLEVDYKKMDDGEISHSAVVNLLSETGEILAQEKGIGSEFPVILEKLK